MSEETDKVFTVYCHTTPSGKRYIGITSWPVQKRWNHGRGYKNQVHFRNAILKYGWDNIKHEILETGLNVSEASEREKEYIKLYDTTNPKKGYNRVEGGFNSTKGYRADSKARKKMSDAQKARYENMTAEKWASFRENIRKNHVSRKPSEEERKKLSENSKCKKQVICLETGVVYSSILDAAEAIGCKKRNSITEACSGRSLTAGGYHWSYYPCKNPVIKKPRKNPRIRAIVKIETGEVFESAAEAARSIGLSYATVHAACNPNLSEQTAGGFHWAYASSKNYAIPEKRKNPHMKAVVNLNTGEKFESATEAARSVGLTIAAISGVCRGKPHCLTAGGYKWAFA